MTHYGFPGLAVVNGDLMTVYREGPQHDIDTGATRGIIYRETSTDDGATWGSKTVVVDDSVGLTDARDPTMLVTQAGTVLVFHTLATSISAFDPYVARSTNNGSSWSQIAITHSFTDYALSAGRCCEAGNGDILSALYGIDTLDAFASVRISRSTDDGQTWAHLADVADGPTDSLNYTEPALCRLLNGDIMCVIRCSTDNKFYKATSSDDGATWSALSAMLTNASARPGPLVMSDGVLAVYYRDAANPGRGMIRYSYDNGSTWTSPQFFYTSALSVYAELVEDIPGQIAAAYGKETTSTISSVHFGRLFRRD